MKITLLAAAAALSLVTATAARAESEGAGDPFPFHASGLAAISPPAYAADTGSTAYPDFTGRLSQIVIVGGPDAVPMTGGEGTVETASSLPRGFLDGTVAYAQARSVARFFAERDGRTRLAAGRLTGAPKG